MLIMPLAVKVARVLGDISRETQKQAHLSFQNGVLLRSYYSWNCPAAVSHLPEAAVHTHGRDFTRFRALKNTANTKVSSASRKLVFITMMRRKKFKITAYVCQYLDLLEVWEHFGGKMFWLHLNFVFCLTCESV